MKRVCWLSDFPLRGSSFATVTSDLLNHMPKDYNFDVLSLGYKGMPLKISDNIRIFEIEKSYQLSHYCQKLKPDIFVVFHSYWLLDSMMPAIDSVCGKKILYIPTEGESVPMQYRKHFLKFDAIATPSEFSKRTLKKAGIDATVVPHGVDAKFFVPKKKDWHEFRFGYLGMNDIRKQIPRVMEAFARVKQGTLVIASENEGHYDLLQLAKEYNISPIFIESKLKGLTMNREAVRDFIQGLDCYISPASESFGLPGLEAQACGVPVIANSHGSSREVLGNGALYANVSDYLETSVGKISLISTADLYRKMRFMVQLPEAWKKTSTKAIVNAQKWTWEKAAKKMEEVFES